MAAPESPEPLVLQGGSVPDVAVRTLSHVPWLDIPGVRAVVWALGRDQVRFVGGCVRDHLMGRTSLDVDIATALPPDESLRRLKAANVRAKPIGIEYGTVVALTSTGQFEITTLRRDVETDGRHAKVAFTNDWVEDASRRDFTINALSVDPDGRLYDPCGGLNDIESGTVRFIGRPEDRIAEDVLRLLRFFRFSAWYARGRLDRAGLDAAARLADRLDTLSGERLSAELRRLLSAPDPGEAVAAMAQHQILRSLTALTIRSKILSRVVALEQSQGLEAAPIGRLAAMLPGPADAYRALAERLRFSKVQAANLIALARPLPELGADARGIRQALYGIGDRQTYRLAALLAAAEGDAADIDLRLKVAAEWAWPKFPVSGLDLLELGVKPGPHVGEILRLVQDWWRRNDFAPTRDQCLAAIQRSLSDNPDTASR